MQLFTSGRTLTDDPDGSKRWRVARAGRSASATLAHDYHPRCDSGFARREHDPCGFYTSLISAGADLYPSVKLTASSRGFVCECVIDRAIKPTVFSGQIFRNFFFAAIVDEIFNRVEVEIGSAALKRRLRPNSPSLYARHPLEYVIPGMRTPPLESKIPSGRRMLPDRDALELRSSRGLDDRVVMIGVGRWSDGEYELKNFL